MFLLEELRNFSFSDFYSISCLELLSMCLHSANLTRSTETFKNFVFCDYIGLIILEFGNLIFVVMLMLICFIMKVADLSMQTYRLQDKEGSNVLCRVLQRDSNIS